MSATKRNKNITVYYTGGLNSFRAYDRRTRKAHWSHHSGARAREELESGEYGMRTHLSNEALMNAPDDRLCI